MMGFNSNTLMAQQQLPYGNMDQWITRIIKESLLIGGNTKTIYAIGPTSTIKGD
ncbi:MAG: glycoside hydrolase xylanase, partial [Porphyromonadaceae bacterium]|nr:glycoside hydrolase xylanase [Porphyromonadaceae bacterium]